VANLREQVDVPDRTVCTALRRGNRDCDGPIPDGAPVTLCWKHLIKAYMFVRDSLGQQPLVSDADYGRGKLRTQFVYYVRFGDRIKIGTTSRLADRLANIPHDEVLAVEPGDVELERQRHNEFAEHHIKGEWFAAHPHLLAHAYRVFLKHPELVP
jgi:hypothetical protein